MDLDSTSEDTGGAHEGGGVPTPLGRAPYLVAPLRSTNVLLSPIYTYVP